MATRIDFPPQLFPREASLSSAILVFPEKSVNSIHCCFKVGIKTTDKVVTTKSRIMHANLKKGEDKYRNIKTRTINNKQKIISRTLNNIIKSERNRTAGIIKKFCVFLG